MIVLYVTMAIIIGWCLNMVFDRAARHSLESFKKSEEEGKDGSTVMNGLLLLAVGTLFWLLLGIGVLKFVEFFAME